MSTSTLTSGYMAGAAMITGSFIFLIIWYVLAIIAFWKMFNKFGEPGWKSIIPFYNLYIVFKYTWRTSFFWILIAAICIAGLGSATTQMADGSSLSITGICVIAMLILTVVIDIMSSYKISKAFGHGIGYFFGILFLPNIFYLILGFGKSEYVGEPDTPSTR